MVDISLMVFFLVICFPELHGIHVTVTVCFLMYRGTCLSVVNVLQVRGKKILYDPGSYASMAGPSPPSDTW
jgi:hypothetical protein